MVRLRTVSALVAATMAFSSCAYIQHPERRGSTAKGQVDTVPLVIDIVWLVVGIIPGVVCLAVDFSSGAIYTGGGAKLKLDRHGDLMVRRPKIDDEVHVRVAIVDESGSVLAEDEAEWSPKHRRGKDTIRVRMNDQVRAAVDAGQALSVQVERDGQTSGMFALELGIHAAQL
jgi:hypothetical protein